MKRRNFLRLFFLSPVSLVLDNSSGHTFDNADMGQRVVEDKTQQNLLLKGDYINLFLQEIMAQPSFVP
jgi:hypothetical protein